MQVGDVADPRGGFGEQLRRDRLTAGLTHEELAETLSLPAPGHEAFAGAPQWRPLGQLPADIADFTGRREQVAQLAGLLGAAGDGQVLGAMVVTAVAGAGGIGKSALAVHAAHQVASRFPDGQLYLNLRGSSPQPVAPGVALARFLRDLGTDPVAMPADEGERAARYRSLLAGRRLLIVLDDARDAAQVRPLLPETAGCAVVVTSRSSLHDLESARLLDLGVLAEADGLALLARIAGPARAAAEPDAVREVLAACGGLPLAIRIAAARLAARPGWSIAALAARLGDARKRLDELRTGDLAVRASFTVSYASLRTAAGSTSEAPDRAFRMLALTDGPDISLPAAAALLGVPQDHAERALELLVNAHLLQSAAPGRYRFHDLLRVYAVERVLAEEDAADRDEAVRRMLGWYVHTAAAAARLVHPNGRSVPLGTAGPGTVPPTFAGYDQALAWLDAEYASLVSAVGQAARHGEHELAWKLPASLWALFYLRGHVGDWVATHQTGLASARLLGDSTAELWILNNLGVAYIHLKRPEAAIDCLRQCLPIVRGRDNVLALARVLVNLGYTLPDVDRDDEAMQSLLESLCLFQKMGNRCGEGIALGGIGKVHRRRGQLNDAIAHYQRALDASRETSDFVTEGTTLVELSAVRLELGQADAAIRAATEAVELYRQTGSRYGHAQAMAVLGRAERDRGHPEQARQCWLDAAAIFTELGLPQAGRCVRNVQDGSAGGCLPSPLA